MLSVFVSSSLSTASLYPPTLDRLPAGAIQPAGWLKKQAHIQAAGSTGGLASWTGGGIAASKYLPDTTNTNGEEQGGEYFINGMFPLTCQIDIPELRDYRERSIAKILKHVSVNGTLGGAIPWTNTTDQKESYWGRMIAVLALETYAECVGPYAPNATMQTAVEAALLKHYSSLHGQVAAEMPPYWHCVWGSARYSENLIGIQWLIDRGHTDPFLFDLLQLFRGKSEEVLGWEQWFVDGNPKQDTTTDTIRCWGNKSDVAERAFQKHHGVTIMEAIKTGPAWYRVSGNASDRDNGAAALKWIDLWARSADGTMTAPDCLSVSAQHVPTTGIETCSVVEAMFSVRMAYEVTGAVETYDRLERIAFNSLPATTDQHFTGNAYYHSVNQVHLDGRDGYGMNGCCTGNVHQGWPKFIMSQVQTQHGKGSSAIVVSGYSPHIATLGDGTTVEVGGQYPFADNATVSVKRAKAGGDWSLSLRIPCWVVSATIAVNNGAGLSAPIPATPCSMFSVPGLQVSATEFSATVTFSHSITVLWNKWNGNYVPPKSSKPKNSKKLTTASPATGGKLSKGLGKGAVEIHRGPLVFTFPIPGKVNSTVLNSTSFGVIHKTAVAIDSSKHFRFALSDPNNTLTFGGFASVGDIPFDRTKPLATITAEACPVSDPGGDYAKGHIPDSPVPLSDCNGSTMAIDLVPIAHSYLRFTVLPVLADN